MEEPPGSDPHGLRRRLCGAGSKLRKSSRVSCRSHITDVTFVHSGHQRLYVLLKKVREKDNAQIVWWKLIFCSLPLLLCGTFSLVIHIDSLWIYFNWIDEWSDIWVCSLPWLLCGMLCLMDHTDSPWIHFNWIHEWSSFENMFSALTIMYYGRNRNCNVSSSSYDSRQILHNRKSI